MSSEPGHADPYCTVRISATNLTGNELDYLFLSNIAFDSDSPGSSGLEFSGEHVPLPFVRSGFAKVSLLSRTISVHLEGAKATGLEATVTVSIESNGRFLALRTLTIPSGETRVDWHFQSPDL